MILTDKCRHGEEKLRMNELWNGGGLWAILNGVSGESALLVPSNLRAAL